MCELFKSEFYFPYRNKVSVVIFYSDFQNQMF